MPTIFWISFAVLWIVVAVQGFAFLEIVRQVALIQGGQGSTRGALILHDILTPGAPLPLMSGLSAVDLSPANWDNYLGGDLGIILCLAVRCPACGRVARELSDFTAAVRERATVVALVRGPVDEVQAYIDRHGLNSREVVIDPDGSTTRALGMSWTPGVITVRGHRLHEAAIFSEVGQLYSLLDQDPRSDDYVMVGQSRE